MAHGMHGDCNIAIIPRNKGAYNKATKQLKHGECRTMLFMGWGPEPVWSSATIQSNDPACQSGKSVVVKISVPPETAKDYTIPGQYVQVRAMDGGDGNVLFLAVASAPSSDSESPIFEFLIKKTDSNGWLTSLTTGATIEMSQVMGSGFRLKENLEGYKYDFPTQNVILLAAGSGLAPIKAAAESGQLEISAGGRTARLYYGERSAADLCYVDRFAMWEQQMGIQVVPVLSQPDDQWEGRIGYVQTALEEDGVPIPRNCGALLCGMKGMTEACKSILVKAGVFEGRVLLNF